MNQQKIELCANEARDLARENQIPVRTAIYKIAKKHNINPSIIARELGRRGGSKKHKKIAPKPIPQKTPKAPITPPSKQELFWEREIDLFYKRRIIGSALARENELRRSFELAGHLDDY